MATDTLERTAEAGISGDNLDLCPWLATAETVDNHPDRRLLAQSHPCFVGHAIGEESESTSRKLCYVRKPCDGYNTNCPSHPAYRH